MATASVPAPVYPAPKPVSGETKAVWVSQFDLQNVLKTNGAQRDQETFTALFGQMMDNIKSYGFNTVFLQARPYSDSFYPSEYFPWSDMVVSSFGEDAEYDPYGIMVTQARKRGLSVHGWINPYRLQASASSPGTLAADNLANTHPDWVAAAGGGLYLNPAIPEAAAYVVEGVAELVRTYPMDGVHFDDYFYPTTDPAIDAARFAASGAADLAEWRRQNVTALVKAAHDAVKAADPTLRFGVSPQGNPDNDMSQQYSDVRGWLAAGSEDAVVDYLCPQLYWGYGYTLSNGSRRFAYENILAEWLAMPRGSAALYVGLGAYRIGEGDGGSNGDSVSGWSTGRALADQVGTLRAAGAGGYALYRYGSLFQNTAWPQLAEAECAALTAANAPDGGRAG